MSQDKLAGFSEGSLTYNFSNSFEIIYSMLNKYVFGLFTINFYEI